MLKESITVLVPAYNEEKLIEDTTLELKAYLNSLKSQGLISSYEIIICINGSNDRTEEISRAISKTHKEVRYFAIRKKGLGIALREGVKRASKDLITFAAADGEGLLDFIERAILTLRKYDFISGSRFLDKSQIHGSNFLRRFLSIGFAFFITIFFSSKLTEVGSNKAFRTDWAHTIINKCKRDDASWQVEILYYAFISDLKIKEIPLNIEIKRISKDSKIQVIDEVYFFLKTTLKFGLALKMYQFKKTLEKVK